MAPKKTRQPPDAYRKLPRQPRSDSTVRTIFEATAQILHRDGITGLNTNKIAERAGFAVGTLYQYFPNKESILRAMAQRESAQAVMRIKRALADAPDATLAESVRAVVHILIDAFRGRNAVRRAVLLTVLGDARRVEVMLATFNEAVELVACALREAHPSHVRRLTEVELFLLTRASLGAIRGAAFEQSPHLGTPAFEQALVDMLVGFLKA